MDIRINAKSKFSKRKRWFCCLIVFAYLVFVLDSVDNNLCFFLSCQGSCWTLIQGQCWSKQLLQQLLEGGDYICQYQIPVESIGSNWPLFLSGFIEVFQHPHGNHIKSQAFGKTTQSNTILEVRVGKRLWLLPGTCNSTKCSVAALGGADILNMSYLWAWSRTRMRRRKCTSVLHLYNRGEGQAGKHSCFRWSWLLRSFELSPEEEKGAKSLK